MNARQKGFCFDFGAAAKRNPMDLCVRVSVSGSTLKYISLNVIVPRATQHSFMFSCTDGYPLGCCAVQVKVRYNTRILRQTERELIPLGKGTVEKVKLLRTARLRKKVGGFREASPGH